MLLNTLSARLLLRSTPLRMVWDLDDLDSHNYQEGDVNVKLGEYGSGSTSPSR